MSSFSNFILVLCVISPILAQKYCQFNGPQELDTLQGFNFIQNVGSGNNCLKLNWFGASYTVPMTLDNCQWNSPGRSNDQHFLVKNSNGGFVLKPMKENGVDLCMALSDGENLASIVCNPKSDQQTWIIKRIRGDRYQIIQKSSGKCIRAFSKGFITGVKTDYCRQGDEFQHWRICTSY